MKRLLIATVAAVAVAATVSAAAAGAENRPRVYLVSDAHLDTQWEWDIQTTISRYVRNTVNRNLTLLQKYPGYVFNFEGGVKYAWIKEYFPREYELMKPYVKSDRWHIAIVNRLHSPHLRIRPLPLTFNPASTATAVTVTSVAAVTGIFI